MDEAADVPQARTPHSVGEVKERAAAVRARSRQVREGRARATGRDAGGPPARFDEPRLLLAWCEATRDISRHLAVSAAAARQAAREQVRSSEATQCRLFLSRTSR